MRSPFLCVLLVATFSTSALADEPRIAVLDVRTSDGKSTSATAAAREALEEALQRYRIQVVTDDPAVKSASGVAPGIALAKGVRAARLRMEEGVALFKRLDAEGAERKLKGAADLYEENAGGLEEPDDLIRTYLELAQVFFATNRKALARDVFQRVVQLNPELTLNPAQYQPEMVSQFNAVKQEILKSPLGSLEVTSRQTATVYLDGRKRGTAGSKPLSMVNLGPGVHVLTLRRDGYAPFVQRVNVTSFRPEKIQVDMQLNRHSTLQWVLDDARFQKRSDPKAKNLEEYLEAVAVQAKLDLIVVGTLSKGSTGEVVQARLYRPGKMTLGTIHSGPRDGGAPQLASDLLSEAANASWIPLLAARLNVEAGGGALDETAAWRVHAFVGPGLALPRETTNFPVGPMGVVRIGLARRITSRLLAVVELGYDATYQYPLVLTGVAESSESVEVPIPKPETVYHSVPVELGVKYYLGVSSWAFFLGAGAGAHYDTMTFHRGRDFEEFSGLSGIGFGGYGALGVDRALSPRTGYFFELRGRANLPGVGNGSTLDDTITLEVDPGVAISTQLVGGYLQMF